MSNDPAQDRYNPPQAGSEFEPDKFYALQEMDIFYFKNKFNDGNLSYRKINQNQGQCIKTGEIINMTPHDSVYIKS
jgi:hypothetical protein